MQTNRRQVDYIAHAMLQAPSPENSQPWKIMAQGNVLEVFHSSERAKLANYPDDLSILGLGMLSESMDLACSVQGLNAHKTYFLEERSDNSPWLKAAFEPAKTTPDPLAKGIFIRHTDRRRFTGGSLDDQVYEDAQKEASTIQGANLYLTNNYPDEYLKLLRDADEAALNWTEMRHDLMRWTRFTDREIERTRDGMSWRSYLRGPETFLDYLRSRGWQLANCLDWFPAWLQKLETRLFDDANELSPLSYDDCAGLGCITTRSNAPEDLVEAGHLAIRVWFALNISGYGLQPLCNLPATIYPERLGVFKLPDHVALTPKAYEIMKSVYRFPDSELPIFSFRSGRAQGEYSAKAKSLRRRDCYIRVQK